MADGKNLPVNLNQGGKSTTGTGVIFQSTIPSQWRLLDRRMQQRQPERGAATVTAEAETAPATRGPAGGEAVASRD